MVDGRELQTATRTDLLAVPGSEVWLAAAIDDLQDPLQTAFTYLKGLEDRFLETLPLVARRSVTVALQAIQQAQDLVDQTLACASAEDIHPAPVRLPDVLEELQGALALWFENDRANLEVRSLPTIHADPGGVRRVLQNLVKNAIKHADGPVHIKVLASRERSGWWITVDDDGPGLPPALCEALGLDAELQPGQGGVGLALCQRVLEAHGGRIHCKLKEEGGTQIRTFWPDKPGRRSAAGRRA